MVAKAPLALRPVPGCEHGPRQMRQATPSNIGAAAGGIAPVQQRVHAHIVDEGCRDDAQMEQLVAGAPQVERARPPALRHPQRIDCCAQLRMEDLTFSATQLASWATGISISPACHIQVCLEGSHMKMCNNGLPHDIIPSAMQKLCHNGHEACRTLDCGMHVHREIEVTWADVLGTGSQERRTR